MSEPISDFDELEAYFDNLVKDNPKLIEQIRRDRVALDRSVPRDCPWGRCEISVDPVTNKIVAAVGPIGCGCDYFPGWKSTYYDGLPMPGFAAKPYGQHGGRIARKRRKTAEHERWLDELALMVSRETESG